MEGEQTFRINQICISQYYISHNENEQIFLLNHFENFVHSLETYFLNAENIFTAEEQLF